MRNLTILTFYAFVAYTEVGGVTPARIVEVTVVSNVQFTLSSAGTFAFEKRLDVRVAILLADHTTGVFGHPAVNGRLDGQNRIGGARQVQRISVTSTDRGFLICKNSNVFVIFRE